MTREEQVREALNLLSPSADERDECQKHVEELLDIMDGARRAVEHAKVTKKPMRAYSAALRRLQAASRALNEVGGALVIPLNTIERKVAFDEEWSAHWTPPSRWVVRVVHQYAVALAYELLSRWTDEAIAISRHGQWNTLASVLYGDAYVNLYRHLRKFDQEIRRRRLVASVSRFIVKARHARANYFGSKRFEMEPKVDRPLKQTSALPITPRLLRLREVEDFSGLRRTQILESVARRTFPPPIRILEGGRAVAWVLEELLVWRAHRIAEHDRQIAKPIKA